MEKAFYMAAVLERAVRAAAAASPNFGPEFDPQLRAADPRFGDYQVNGVLAHAKRLGVQPRVLAAELAALLQASDWAAGSEAEISVAGPGFINIRLLPAWHLAWLQQFDGPAAYAAGASQRMAGRTVVVDFSSPNTAKEMHVGHIRSTVIGEAICRLLAFCGARVIRDNHIGDWGTQFGMLIHAIKTTGYDLANPGDNALAELEQLYQQGHAAYKEGGEQAEQVRAELVKLQQGDPTNLGIWQRISDVSWQAFATIYQRLGVHFDYVLGESHYRDQVDAVYGELQSAGLAVESDGALVVFHAEHPRFATQPFIIRKADGASNYATTDLATVWMRTRDWRADEIIYVVDARQSDHFEQLFLTVSKWYAARGWPQPALRHVSFGTILGPNGKPIKTKEGGSVKLRSLLQEAVDQSRAIVDEKSPDLPAAEREAIAETVGIGAVRYADLSQNRTSDYVFAWDKMLALDGNTAPYLLYAVARVHSLFRKAGLQPGEGEAGADAFATEPEQRLARHLTQYPVVLEQALSDLRPHYLCGWLYDLAGLFSAFYKADKVIVDEPPVRARRLLLCSRTLATLEHGLGLLGMATLNKM
jgi:arginyl-tRNA synthetase